MEIIPAHTWRHFQKLEQLAFLILPAVYKGKSPVDLTRMFLEKNQTAEAIAKQVKTSECHYYLLVEKNEVVGYLGLAHREEVLYLSKLYLLNAARGKGYGKVALDFVDAYVNQHSFKSILLTVNRKNKRAIEVYRENGYEVVREVINDFGTPYTVEDYEMEKQNPHYSFLL